MDGSNQIKIVGKMDVLVTYAVALFEARAEALQVAARLGAIRVLFLLVLTFAVHGIEARVRAGIILDLQAGLRLISSSSISAKLELTVVLLIAVWLAFRVAAFEIDRINLHFMLLKHVHILRLTLHS